MVDNAFDLVFLLSWLNISHLKLNAELNPDPKFSA
jgi:hypothetical protein